ncbi:hypothetical protein GCM10025857_06870 [Alicyclobacillus contaminans]|nr:hypothetical protein GCM10025857_06870 [Alicyclobacillus contaminans]
MATNREDDDQELKEMYDLHIDRVDGVTEPASGMRFLVIKSESGEGGQTLDELLDHARKGVTKPSDGGDEQSQNEKLHQEAEERAKKYGISFKKGKGHLTPPKGKPTDPEQYADPVNYAYPIDEEHIRAAVAYFNQDGQREDGGYTSEEWAIIGKRIATAANKLIGDGYKFEDGKIVTPNNQKSETKKGAETCRMWMMSCRPVAAATATNMRLVRLLGSRRMSN